MTTNSASTSSPAGPSAQLTLIDAPKDWRLDARTREVGREGIARARRALQAGLRDRPDDPPGGPGRRAIGGPHRRAA
jgi:hypothetical protein